MYRSLLILISLFAFGESRCFCYSSSVVKCRENIQIEDLYQLSCKAFVSELDLASTSIFSDCPIDLKQFFANIELVKAYSYCDCFLDVRVDCAIPPTPPFPSATKTNSIVLIVGIVIILLIVIAVSALIGFCHIRNRRQLRDNANNEEAPVESLENPLINLENLENPDNDQPQQQNDEIEREQQSHTSAHLQEEEPNTLTVQEEQPKNAQPKSEGPDTPENLFGGWAQNDNTKQNPQLSFDEENPFNASSLVTHSPPSAGARGGGDRYSMRQNVTKPDNYYKS